MTYRVIQWATGSMGKACLRAVIDHPDLELAGLLVYSESKAGKDAGEIAHRVATGVLATRDVEAILALEADVAQVWKVGDFAGWDFQEIDVCFNDQVQTRFIKRG